MPRLLAQTAKLFEEEVASTTCKQVWPFIDDMSSCKLYT
jgi:hypothetical protein